MVRASAHTSYPTPGSPLGMQYKRAAAFCGDLLWHATRRRTAEIWARNGVPGWAYLFDVLPSGISDAVGVTHFLKVAYVFSNIGAAAPQEHTEVANLMSRYWASFLADLDPNSGNGIFYVYIPFDVLACLILIRYFTYHP